MALLVKNLPAMWDTWVQSQVGEMPWRRDWHWKIDTFQLWCWRRLLRISWTVRRSNQTILKEIGPEYSLEGLMLKLKLQSFGHLMQRTDSLEKTLMLGKIEGRKRRDEMVEWHHRLNRHELSKLGSWWWTGKPGVLQSTGSQRVGHNWATDLNWLTLLG